MKADHRPLLCIHMHTTETTTSSTHYLPMQYLVWRISMHKVRLFNIKHSPFWHIYTHRVASHSAWILLLLLSTYSVFLSFNFGFSCNSTWTHEWNFMKFLPCFFSVFTLEWNFSFCFVLYSLHESPTENDDCLSSGRQAKVVRWIFSFQSENFNAIYSILISLRA